MLTQHYKIKASAENIQIARPGEFVFEDDVSEEPIGFIDFVSDCELAIMLFEPKELTGDMYKPIAYLADWETRLQEIIDDDPIMKEVWDVIWK